MKFVKYLLFIFCFLFLISCSNFLALEIPSQVVSPDNFYKTNSSFITALNGTYAQLNNLAAPIIWFGDAGTDISAYGLDATKEVNDKQELINNQTDGQNTIISDFWKYSYILINNSNKIIQEADKLPFDLVNFKDKYRYIAEAKFLRALAYFYLVQSFGQIPLKLIPSDPSQGNITGINKPVSDIYDAIIGDLRYCQGFYVAYATNSTIPSYNFYLKKTKYSGIDLGRPDFFVAKALLAKVFLTKSSTQTGAARFASLDSARRLSSEVIGSGLYTLNKSYKDCFNPDSKTGSNENMFSIQFSSTFKSNVYQIFGASIGWVKGLPAALQSPWGGYFGSNQIQVSESFISQFSASDNRLSVSAINTVEINSGSLATAILPGYVTAKYYDESFASGSGGGITGGNTSNLNILRYADVLLMYAEAENEINGPSFEAYDKLNQVLQRAGLPNINANGGVTQDNFRSEILKQRALEFCYEGQRRFDLVRTGKLTQKLIEAGKPAPQYTTFPYPQNELSHNPQ